MGCLPCLLVLLTGSLGLPAVHSCDFYRRVGQDLMLPFIFDGLDLSHVLRWTHNKTIVFYRQKGHVSIGNATDISLTGSLLLKNLQYSSAGDYQVNVLHANNTLAKQWTGRLCVVDRVPKPQLSFSCDFPTSSVLLNCQVDNPRGLEFSWAIDGKSLISEKKQKLSISLSKLKAGSGFMCNAAHVASTEKLTSNVVYPVCKTPALMPLDSYCFSLKTVQAVFAGGAGLVVLLLTIIITMCCHCQRRQGPPGAAGSGGFGMRGARNAEELDSIPDYETMLSPKDPQKSQDCYSVVPPEDSTASEPSRLPVAEVGQRDSPVPKPRTKSPKTQTSKLWSCEKPHTGGRWRLSPL